MINKLYLLQKYLEKEGLRPESLKASELFTLYSLDKNAEFLTAQRSRLESITWNGKTYNALGYLPDGSAVALILREDIEGEDVSVSGPFKLLGQTNISVTNADETQNYNLTQYQGGNVLPVSVRSGAVGVTENKVAVDYGDVSNADIAIEIAAIIGAVPVVGEPVDIGASVLAVIKDPPDYLMGVIGILCALPVFGVGAALARPVLKRAGINGIAEVVTEHIKKHLKERSSEIIALIRQQSAALISELKEEAPKIVDKYDLASALVTRERLSILEDHIDDIVKSIDNYLRERGTSLAELGPDFLTALTKNRSFQSFYQGSTLVDDLGRPIPLFHGTISPGNFSIPSTSGPPPGSVGFVDPNIYLGAHFAQEAEVAADFAVGALGQGKREGLTELGYETGEGRTLAVFANVKNPLDMDEDTMHKLCYEGFAPDEIIEKMFEHNLSKGSRKIADKEAYLSRYNSDPKFRKDANFEFVSLGNPLGQDVRALLAKLGGDLKEKLKASGYDAIRYGNLSETAGTGRSGISWIIFEQSQIRPVSDFVN